MTAELGVLLLHQQSEVAGDQAQEDQRDDEDVEDEEPGGDQAVAGEVPAEDE